MPSLEYICIGKIIAYSLKELNYPYKDQYKVIMTSTWIFFHFSYERNYTEGTYSVHFLFSIKLYCSSKMALYEYTWYKDIFTLLRHVPFILFCFCFFKNIHEKWLECLITAMKSLNLNFLLDTYTYIYWLYYKVTFLAHLIYWKLLSVMCTILLH